MRKLGNLLYYVLVPLAILGLVVFVFAADRPDRPDRPTSVTPLTKTDIYVDKILMSFSATQAQTTEYENAVVTFLENASPTDKVYVHINTPGGYTVTLMHLMNAIETTKANLVCLAEGSEYSAGAALAMACPKLIISPHGDFIFHLGHHNVPAGLINKEVVNDPRDPEMYDYMDIMKRKVFPFMTQKEIADFMAGKDIYIQNSDMKNRIERHSHKNGK